MLSGDAKLQATFVLLSKLELVDMNIRRNAAVAGIQKIKQFVKRRFVKPRQIPIQWIKRDENSWLVQNVHGDFVRSQKRSYTRTIERIADATNALGEQPLWEGYSTHNTLGANRMPDVVRTDRTMGDWYASVTEQRSPNIIVEFGTAFGVSGMYFLAGLESNKHGRLLTFEPNGIWANIARRNLQQIGDRFELTVGTFEENISSRLSQDETIDLAFIDAIHKKEFVAPQLEIILANSSSKALIILDDIYFSDCMKEYWNEISQDSRFSASVAFGNRVGVLELKN